MLLLNCSFMVQTKGIKKKWLSLKYAFMVLLETEWKIKVCVMQNKGLDVKMIKWGITTSKLHFLLIILVPCWQIFTRLLKQGFLDEMFKMRGQNLMLTSKLHVVLNILAPSWWPLTDFHKTYPNFNREYLGSMLTDFQIL